MFILNIMIYDKHYYVFVVLGRLSSYDDYIFLANSSKTSRIVKAVRGFIHLVLAYYQPVLSVLSITIFVIMLYT